MNPGINAMPATIPIATGHPAIAARSCIQAHAIHVVSASHVVLVATATANLMGTGT